MLANTISAQQAMPEANALVIVPTYNEKENIALLIPAIFALPAHFHVLVVDDASPDGTAQTVQALQQAYPQRLHLINRPTKQGLGSAYIAGFKFALQRTYQYILTMDADFSHAPADLPRLYHACQQNAQDLVIGSRYISGVNIVNWPMRRVLLSYSANAFARCITGMPVQDLTAGFQCYRRTVLETLDLDTVQSVGYIFQVEMKFLAWQYGFALQEVPIVFTNRIRGSSKMSQGILLEALRQILRLKVNSWFSTYHRPMPGVTAASSHTTR